MDIIINTVFSFTASLCFAVVFNIRDKNLVFSAIGGMIGWMLFYGLSFVIQDDIIKYFVASVAVSFYSRYMAKRTKSPVLVFLVVAIIPLVPGYSIYKTMENLLMADTQTFIDSAVYTFKVAMVIATGFLLSTSKIELRGGKNKSKPEKCRVKV